MTRREARSKAAIKGIAATIAGLSVYGLGTHPASAALPALSVPGGANRIYQNGRPYMLAGIGLALDDGLANQGLPANQQFHDTTAYDSTNYAKALNYLKSVADLVSNRNPLYGKPYGWGSRMIRLAVTPNWFDPNQDGTTFDSYKLAGVIDNVVAPFCAYCQAKNIYVVLTPGYVTDVTYYMLQPDIPQWGQNHANGVIWKIWDFIANPGYDSGHNQHAALRGSNVIYEPYNEPVGDTVNGNFSGQAGWNSFQSLIQYVVNHIRYDCGVSNVCLIGSLGWSSQLAWIPQNPVTGGNIGYVAHIYPGTPTQDGTNASQVTQTLSNQYSGTADQVPVVVTEYNWFNPSDGQNSFRQNPYLATSSVFGQGLKNWTNAHAAGFSCWTYGEMLQGQNFNVNATALDPDTEDYGQFNYQWLWETFFYNGGQVVGGFNANNTFRLTPLCNTNACLDLIGGATGNGTPIQEYGWWGGTNQKWYIQDLNNGRYRITPLVNGNAALDVYAGSTANGTKVSEWGWNGGPNQCWWITSLGDGSYRLSPSSGTDCALDVSGGNPNNGTGVAEWGWNGSAAQRWFLNQQ